MNDAALYDLLEDVAKGRVEINSAIDSLRSLPFADIGFARVDHHRELRQGIPEAIYAPGKTVDECVGIAAEMLDGPSRGPVIMTRVDDDTAATVVARVPGAIHHRRARLVVWRPAEAATGRFSVVVAAGTADLAVADEAATTLAALGEPVRRITDVGVAGLHRLAAAAEEIRGASCVIAVAGMEGALPTAIGGMIDAPVIAVPTSAGYGASFDGLSALLAMLASCVPGITVTGVDNGFGAACAARRILRTSNAQQ